MRSFLFALLALAAAAAPLFLSAQQTVSIYQDVTILAKSQEKLEARIYATGEVELRYKSIKLFADKIDLDTNTKDVLAVGHVTIQLPNETITAESMTLNLDTQQGKLEHALGRVQPDILYESASIERKSDSLYAFGKMSFTSCVQPTPRWGFSAAQANFKKNDYVEMWGATLRIKNIPVFYMPYMRYPLNQDRATGFLIPQIGYNQIKGVSLSQGFYWAIARNMDATFSFDYYASKGVGGGLEYRYLFGDGTNGQANVYYFMFKTPVSGEKPENAYIIRWNHSQTLPFGFNFVAAVDSQNSFQFLQEFDNDFRRSLVFNRSSQAYVTKSWKSFSFSARAGRFETSFPTMDASIVTRYLPSIGFSAFKMKIFKPLYFSFDSSFNNMEYGWDYMYEAGSQFKNQDFNFHPALTLPFSAIPWLTMDFSLSSNLSRSWRSIKPGVGIVDEPVWTGNYTGSVSMTGPVLYRIWDLKPRADGQMRRLKHIFEPFVSYQYESPYFNQERIASAYAIYRYHVLTYGLNNHLLLKEGPTGAPREIFTMGVSQGFFIEPEFGPYQYYRINGEIPSFSELSGYVRYYPSGVFSLDTGASYNTYTKDFSLLRVGANFTAPSGNLVAGVNWYKSVNPYYKNPYYDRHQIGGVLTANIPALDLEVKGDVSFNIAEMKFFYAGGSFVYHYQCLDIKGDVQVFFFRETPEVQFKISFGLGNIGKTTDFLGGAEILK
jgi:lipopolysaccharide assembly outer membrane protein LptD (OstA)